ncbi:MAG: hypothetical protein IT335_03455, partial [Thermomicrobiales bacterium]|nr:hypothetical protein [Thermomicrobiales bacterium]
MPGQTQTFLIGDSLYLRPVRYDDATTAAIWSASSFPAPDEVVRESLKKRLEVGFAVQNANQLIIACRRADDSIVGSAAVAITPFRSGEIELSIDRLAPPPMRHAIANELAEILVRWLLQECNLKWAALIADDAPEAPLETVTKLGGREAWRLRGASGAGERRRDRMCWQFFNPVWRALLGEPPPVRIGEPATRSWPSWPETQREGNTDLARAIAIGNRVYLRPIEPDESITVSEAWLQETEHYLPGG